MSFTNEIKSNLAKLMSTEDINVTHKNIRTAYFDTKNRILALPTWDGVSDDLYNMLISHEVSHALYTPETYGDQSVWSVFKRIPLSYINIVEDARIERMIKAKYPGVVKSFLAGYKELMKRPGFTINDFGSLNLIDRLNVFFKGGAMMGIPFSDEEKVFVNKMMKTNTFEEVCEVAEEIYEFSKNNDEDKDSGSTDTHFSMENEDGEVMMPDFDPTQEPEEQEDDGSNAGDDSDEETEDESEDEGVGAGDDSDEETEDDGSSAGDDSDDSDEETEDDGSSAGDDSDEETEDETEDGGDPDDRNVETGNVDKYSSHDDRADGGTNHQEEDLESVTDDMFSDVIDSLDKETHDNNIPADGIIPDFDVDKFVVGYKEVNEHLTDTFINGDNGFSYYNRFEHTYNKVKEDFQNYKRENAKVVNYLAKKFEMKKAATAHRNTSIAKTGKINIGKVYKYQLSDDIFLRKAVVKDEKNHGIILFIDWSGSMVSNIKDAIHQIVNLTMFAKRVGIPFEVYSFGNGTRTESFDNWYSNEYKLKDGEVVFDRTQMRNYLSSKMTPNEFNNGLINLLTLAELFVDHCVPTSENLGMTPLDDTLLKSGKLIERFKATNGVEKVNLVIVTDGASNHFRGVGELQDNGRVYMANTNTYRIKDKKSSKTYTIGYHTSTNDLIRMVSDRYNLNVIGYYIVNGKNDLEHAVYNYVMSKDDRMALTETMKTFTYLHEAKEYRKNVFKKYSQRYNKEKFLETEQSGFDRYFIIPGKKVGKDKELNPDMTKVQMKNAFIRGLKKNTDSRVVMSKFIDMIA